MFTIGKNADGEITVGFCLNDNENKILGVQPGDKLIHLPDSMKYAAKVWTLALGVPFSSSCKMCLFIIHNLSFNGWSVFFKHVLINSLHIFGIFVSENLVGQNFDWLFWGRIKVWKACSWEWAAMNNITGQI